MTLAIFGILLGGFASNGMTACAVKETKRQTPTKSAEPPPEETENEEDPDPSKVVANAATDKSSANGVGTSANKSTLPVTQSPAKTTQPAANQPVVDTQQPAAQQPATPAVVLPKEACGFFDDEAYYAAYPGLKAALAAGGTIKSGCDHYLLFGIAENRRAYCKTMYFSEQIYLNAHPDIALALSKSQISSGCSHYIFFGFKEGRSLGK
jgi:hypothetical protein